MSSTNAPRVVVVDEIHPAGIDLLRAHDYDVVTGWLSEAGLEQQVTGADAVIVRTTRIDGAALDAAPHLRVIAKHGVGVDNLDVDDARRRGIRLAYTPGAAAEAVAEHALTLMLAVAKRLILADVAVRSGDFAFRDRSSSVELQGKTLGLLGAGRIGRALGRICYLGLGMTIVYFDAAVAESELTEIAATRVVSLEELFRQSDVISVHVPRTAETEGLIGRDILDQAKPGAILVNTARGGIVSEVALAQALRDGRLAGAGIDVFDTEPPTDSPLLGLPNVVLTPHVAGLTEQARHRMSVAVAEEVVRVLSGEDPRWPL